MRGDGRILNKKHSRFPSIAYYRDGKEIRESAAPAIREAEAKKGQTLTHAEAKQVARQFLKMRVRAVANDREGIQAFIGPAQERIKVSELLDDLVSKYRLGGKKGIPREPDAPMLSHLKLLRDHVGDIRAMALTQRKAEDFVSLLKNQGYANGTINRTTQLLGQAFEIAANADPLKVRRRLAIQKLDESENVRKGKFTEREAELIFASLPPYMADVAQFAYQTGCRSGEILELRWQFLDGDAISVAGNITKNRTPHSIVLTPEVEEIIARRRAARLDGSQLIFHHDGRPIKDYRKCWHSACVVNGLGQFYCRECLDEDGKYTSVLDAERRCPKCGVKWKSDTAKYIGKLFHDFRRTAAHEMWKAGSTIDDCKQVTGHKTDAMFKRYADLFSEEEVRNRQREVQRRRREWREMEAEQAKRAASAQPQTLSRQIQ